MPKKTRDQLSARFVLRGAEWPSSSKQCETMEPSSVTQITKTEISSLGTEGRECILGNVYIKAPDLFLGRDNHNPKGPSASSVRLQRCHWCRLPISEKFKLPLKELAKVNTFISQGQFCDKRCAKAFCIDNLPKDPELYSKALSTLELLHRRETDSCDPIREAPPWCFLAEYGGPWTAQQYRENSELGYTYFKNMSQHIPRPMNIPVSSYYREYS